MILVDTSVLVEWTREGDGHKKQLFENIAVLPCVVPKTSSKSA